MRVNSKSRSTTDHYGFVDKDPPAVQAIAPQITLHWRAQSDDACDIRVTFCVVRIHSIKTTGCVNLAQDMVCYGRMQSPTARLDM